jgi:hypothetical protein
VPAQHGFGFYNKQRGSPADEPPIRQNPETPVRIREARPRLVTLQDQQVLAETKLSAISNTLGRMAAAIAHSKQRNIHHSRMLSDKQEADAVQRRQRKPFEITILRPSTSTTKTYRYD